MKSFLQFICILVLLIVLAFSMNAQSNKIDKPYLGQNPPGKTPEIFAPGIISLDNRLETYPTFSPDGKEMFFSVVNSAWNIGTIFNSKLVNGNWTQPDTAIFSKNNYINWESFISPDGKKQFFASNRPPSNDMDIWMTELKSGSAWQEPVRLNSPVNSAFADGSACVVSNGNLYFTSRRGGGVGGSMIFRSQFIDNNYPQIENLGGIIKTTTDEAEPFVAPDESYMIFISQNRQGGYGGWDLWICFKNKDNSWSEPVNMGKDINSAKEEYGPRVTPDGKYLFFTRETRGKDMDIYWVSAGIIDSLKSANFIQNSKLYLGQTSPGNEPKIFKLPVIERSFAAERIAISKDGKDVFYQELDGYTELDGKPHTQRLKHISHTDSKWGEPKVLFESLGSPSLSITGDTMFLQKSLKEAYYTIKNKNGWSEPKRFLTNFKITHYLQVTNSGNYYISSFPPNTLGGIDRSRLVINGSDTTTSSLGGVLNSAKHDLDYFIARDESFFIITSEKGLCISFKIKDGIWSSPQNLGEKINFGLAEWGPYVTADYNYLFYTTGTKEDYSDTYIYWVKVDELIENLRKNTNN